MAISLVGSDFSDKPQRPRPPPSFTNRSPHPPRFSLCCPISPFFRWLANPSSHLYDPVLADFINKNSRKFFAHLLRSLKDQGAVASCWPPLHSNQTLEMLELSGCCIASTLAKSVSRCPIGDRSPHVGLSRELLLHLAQYSPRIILHSPCHPHCIDFPFSKGLNMPFLHFILLLLSSRINAGCVRLPGPPHHQHQALHVRRLGQLHPVPRQHRPLKGPLQAPQAIHLFVARKTTQQYLIA